MGFLFPDKNDIFISYAHDDNQNFGDWIHAFVELFRELFPAQLRRVLGNAAEDLILKQRLQTNDIKVFVDYTGLPTAGDVNETLLREVENSCFLFVFIGLGYVKSEWCEREFNSFGKKFSNISEKLVNFVQLIFLEQDALSEMKGNGPSGDAKRRGFYIRAYDVKNQLPPRYLNDDGAAVDNAQFTQLVKSVVETHVRRTIDTWGQQTHVKIENPSQAFLGKLIAFGFPQTSVREPQAAIIRGLELLGFSTICLTAEDILEGGTAVNEKLKSAQLFVVLFDDSSAKALEAQEELVSATGTKSLWCWLDTAKDIETNAARNTYLAKKKETAVKKPVPELPDQITKAVTGPTDTSVTATILFDQTLDDQESCEKIKVYINRIWQEDYHQAQPLRFISLDLPIGEDSDLEPFESVHGIVIVDRTRTDMTILTRVLKLDDVLGKNQNIPGKSIFVLEPKKKARNQNWPAIVFGTHDGGDNYDVLSPEKLNNFLKAVHDKSIGANAT